MRVQDRNGWGCYGLRPLSRWEHATDDLPRLLYRDVVGYGAGGGLGQDSVGVAEEGVLLVLVLVFDAKGAAYEGEVVLDSDGVSGFEAAHVTLAAALVVLDAARQ